MSYSPPRRFHRSPRQPDVLPVHLYLNHDATADRLVAIEFGAVELGQPPGFWIEVTRDLSWLAPDDFTLGFKIERFSSFNPDARPVRQIWESPRFCAPALGLADSTAGEIIIAARHYFDGRSSINRHHHLEASARSGEEALPYWRACLESGDASAHYGLGYTLWELERHQEAYRHLRHFAEIAPHAGGHWCWYGKAAHALGLWEEARHAYEIAVELESEGGDVTEAQRLLDELP